jgi:hypothetical protein
VDFIVRHVRKFTVLGEADASLGIYLGDYPSSRYQGSAKNGTSILLGKTVQWDQSTTSDQGVTLIRAGVLVQLGPSILGAASPSYADIFLHAGDTPTVQMLKSIAATIGVRNNKAAR